MSNIVYIRADGNSEIGMGHLVRCLALSYMLNTEFTINFICKFIPKNIQKEITENGFLLTLIKEESEFIGLLTSSDIVVLDHYQLGAEFQALIRKKRCKLVCIDDLHSGKFFADLIINQAPSIKMEEYTAEVYTQFALGLDYALLRPAFLESVNQKLVKREEGTLLICFGGSDYRNLTHRCLQVVKNSKQFKKIILVVGAAYKHKEGLLEVIDNKDNIYLFQAITASKMLELMQLASIAIVPSSGVLLEAFSAGCKIISGMYVDNQRYIYSQYKNINAFIDAEDFSIKALKKALTLYKEVKHKENKIIIDGQSGSRILKLFQQLRNENFIHLRNAVSTDVEITFLWAKDPAIRTFSFNQTEILKEEHTIWFYNKLKSDGCFFYIAELACQPIGSIRFDVNDRVATISYLIDSKYHGKGFGIILLKLGIMKVKSFLKNKNIKTIVGYVMPKNIPSVRAFERLGFKKYTKGQNLKFGKFI